MVAALFFVTCLALAYLAANREGPSSIIDSVVETQSEQPTSPPLLQEPASMDLPPADSASESPAADSADSDLPPAE